MYFLILRNEDTGRWRRPTVLVNNYFHSQYRKIKILYAKCVWIIATNKRAAQLFSSANVVSRYQQTPDDMSPAALALN